MRLSSLSTVKSIVPAALTALALVVGSSLAGGAQAQDHFDLVIDEEGAVAEGFTILNLDERRSAPETADIRENFVTPLVGPDRPRARFSYDLFDVTGNGYNELFLMYETDCGHDGCRLVVYSYGDGQWSPVLDTVAMMAGATPADGATPGRIAAIGETNKYYRWNGSQYERYK